MSHSEETQGAAGSQSVSEKDSEQQQPNEATGEVSSQEQNPGSDCKTSEDSKARVKRFKLFEKVMQKSLEKFIEQARYILLVFKQRSFDKIALFQKLAELLTCTRIKNIKIYS